MQAVCGHEVAGGEPGRGDVVDVLAHLVDALPEHPYAELCGAFGQCGLQHRPPGAEPRAGPEEPLRVPAAHAVDVADAVERLSGHGDAQLQQPAHGARHQALPAGLVDGRGPRLHDHHLQAGERAVDGGGQSGRPAARDQQVDHGLAPADGTEPGARSRPPSVRAASSQPIRTRRRSRLSTVKPSAVSQAECTSGSAIPSATTAT